MPHLQATTLMSCISTDRCVPQQQQQQQLQLQLLVSHSCVCYEQYLSRGPLLAQVKQGLELGDGRGWCQVMPSSGCYTSAFLPSGHLRS